MTLVEVVGIPSVEQNKQTKNISVSYYPVIHVHTDPFTSTSEPPNFGK